VESVEYGDAVGAADDRFAVDRERLGGQFGGSDRDSRIAIGPVIIAAAREQAHVGAIATDDQPIAVVLDLMHPAGPDRRLIGEGGDAGVDEAVGANNEHIPSNSGSPAESGGPEPTRCG